MIICESFTHWLPDSLQNVAFVLGYKKICFPEFLINVVQYWKDELISTDQLFSTINYLYEKGIIYIQ